MPLVAPATPMAVSTVVPLVFGQRTNFVPTLLVVNDGSAYPADAQSIRFPVAPPKLIWAEVAFQACVDAMEPPDTDRPPVVMATLGKEDWPLLLERAPRNVVSPLPVDAMAIREVTEVPSFR